MAVGSRGVSSDVPEFRPSAMIDRVLGGRYRLLDVVGVGGMGAVFKGLHLLLERQVAVKVLSPTWLSVPNIKERFAREARVTNRIAHPNVLDVEDLGETEEGLPYQVMDYLQGETLHQRLRRGRMPLAELLDVTLQVCRGLAAAHDLGIVHRDVTPSNIFLVRRGTAGAAAHVVKILDFGIAFVKAEARLTLPGQVMGTPHYLAPELVVAGDVTPAADIYSLGAVLYEALAGRPVFDDPNPATLAMMHAAEDPAPLSESCEDVPPRLAGLVMRCLRKHAPERPEDVRAVADEVRAVMREESIPVRPSVPPAAADDRAARAPALPPESTPAPAGASIPAWRDWVVRARAGALRAGDEPALARVERLERALDEIQGLEDVIARHTEAAAEVEDRRTAMQERFDRALEGLTREEERLIEKLASWSAALTEASARLDARRDALAAARRQVAAAEDAERRAATLPGRAAGADDHVNESLLGALRTAGEAAATYEQAAALERAARKTRRDCEDELKDARLQIAELRRNSERQFGALEAEARDHRGELAKHDLRRQELYRAVIQAAAALAEEFGS